MKIVRVALSLITAVPALAANADTPEKNVDQRADRQRAGGSLEQRAA